MSVHVKLQDGDTHTVPVTVDIISLIIINCKQKANMQRLFNRVFLIVFNL